MKETIIDYLRLGRAQTYPADWLLVLVPFLTGVDVPLIRVIALSVFMFLVHIISFGENSLHDYIGGWDKVDEAKIHHPLQRGAILVDDAIGFVHWGKNLLMFLACLMAFLWSPSPVMAMFCLFQWYAWGTGYNLGLSKVSLLGFLPICICFVAMGGFGWFLSHEKLTPIGWWYLAYIFTVILFQISYSGHLKEMGQAERSNLLIKMGAKLTDGFFQPGWAFLYGFAIKGASLYILIKIMGPILSGPAVVWFILILLGVGAMTALLCMPRDYDRVKDLKRMSLMEIISIYAPIPLMISWELAAPLMLIGVVYFYAVNKALWGVLYPKV